MKRFIALLLFLIMLSSSFAMGEPKLEKVKYIIPETKYVDKIEELYGVWKFEYISIDGTVYSIDSYLDFAAYVEDPDLYKKKEHAAYFIFDGTNEAAAYDETFVTSAILGALENGKIKETDSDGTITISGLLADGNYYEQSTIDNMEIKMIAKREPYASALIQNGWLKINTETGVSYEDFKGQLLEEDVQDEQSDGIIYLVNDPQGITLYLTGEYSMFGSNTFNVDYVIVNNTNASLDLSFDSIVINGWEVNEMLSGLYNLGSKNKKKGNLTIFLSDADITSMSEIKKMDLNFHISDADKYKILKNYGPFSLKFDGKKWMKVK